MAKKTSLNAAYAGFAKGFEEMKAEVISLREENKRLRSALVWLDNWLGDKPMPECVKRIKDALRSNARVQPPTEAQP